MEPKRFFVLEEESLEEETNTHAAAASGSEPGPEAGAGGSDSRAVVERWVAQLEGFIKVSRFQVEAMYVKYRHLPEAEAFTVVVNELLDVANTPTQVVEAESPPRRDRQTQPRATREEGSSRFFDRATPVSALEVIVLDDLEGESSARLVKKAKPSPVAAPKWSRYIGAFLVRAWAVRPTVKPLEYHHPLRLKRLIPKSLKKGAARFGSTAVIRLEDPLTQREIGRLPEDITKMLSPLLDLSILRVGCRVIFCEGRLSTGDSFGVELECALTALAFENAETGAPPPVTTTKEDPFAQEPESEAILKLRQKNVVRLFAKLNLHSLGLEPVLDCAAETDVTPPEAEVLNANQLKELYRSLQQASMLDTLPETVPPETFTLELRPYQKQGLTWLLHREKEVHGLQRIGDDPPDRDEGVPQPLNQDEREPRPFVEAEVSLSPLGVEGAAPDFTQRVTTNLTPDAMLAMETQEGMLNPLWKEYEWPVEGSKDLHATGDAPPPDNRTFYANMYSGELSLAKPVIRHVTKGGILADEMGLGKTISLLALVHSAPFDKLYSAAEAAAHHYAFRTTLVVVPMSLLSQWQKEFEVSNRETGYKCYVYYGSDSSLGDLTGYLCDNAAPVVMLTTYGTIMSEWDRQERGRAKLPGFWGGDSSSRPLSGLFSVKFFRLVLDEGHTIRNRATKTTKAVYGLRAARKWLITGTPIINRLDDLFSLVKFLELEPWCNVSYWKAFITVPFESNNVRQALEIVKAILEPIIMRRTKTMRQRNGRPLVELPEKEVVLEYVKFDAEERIMYEWFLKRAETSFQEGLQSGELLKRYTTILVHILRLRQLCCHPKLVGTAGDDLEAVGSSESMNLDTYIPHLGASCPTNVGAGETPAGSLAPTDMDSCDLREGVTQLGDLEATRERLEGVDLSHTECLICTAAPIERRDLCLTPCGHTYCLECLLEHIAFQAERSNTPQCPLCRSTISKKALFRIRPSGALYQHDPTMVSSKIKALLAHLRALRDQRLEEQVIVFSQFSAYLDLIEAALAYESDDYTVSKFDGRLSMQERQAVLERFQETAPQAGKITVLLLSLKAGGVGLNLTRASRGFMMDPWWSRGIEDQAIDRIHRIGQMRSVKVVRFIMEGSIEGKMLQIQERKAQLGEVVGAPEEEKRQRRIEEIQLLFGG